MSKATKPRTALQARVYRAALRFDRQGALGDPLRYPSAFDDLRDMSMSFGKEYTEYIQTVFELEDTMNPTAVY